MIALINKVLEIILTMMALLAPVIIGILIGMILPMSLTKLFSEANFLDFAFHVSIQDISFHFSPAQCVMSLDWMQKIIQASGSPTFLSFALPLLIDAIIGLIVISGIYRICILVFGSVGALIIFLRSIPGMILYTLKLLIKALWKSFFGETPFRSGWIWISTYSSFLYTYTVKLAPLYILRTHLAFLMYLLPGIVIPKEGRLYHIFNAGFESRASLKSINTVLNRIFKDRSEDGAYAGDYMQDKEETSFIIYRGGSQKTIQELKKIVDYQEDLFQILPYKKAKITITNHDDGIRVVIRESFKWSIRKIDMPALISLIKGRKGSEVVVGFSQDGEPCYMDVLEMGMIAIIAVTQAGKDVLSRLILGSLASHKFLRASGTNTHQYKKSEILVWYADVKGVDGFWIRNIPGFTRIPNSEDAIAVKLEELRAEMTRRGKKYEERNCSNIADWNRNYPSNPDPYIIFVLNEVNSVLSGDATRIMDSLLPIMAMGNGLGLRIWYLGQSGRRDGNGGNSYMGKLLVNVSTRAVGCLSNPQEQRIALGNNYKDFNDIERFNFVFLKDGIANEIVRPYLIESREVQEWAQDAFVPVLEEEQTVVSTEGFVLNDEDPSEAVYQQKKSYQYLEKVDIQGLFTEAFKDRKLSRERAFNFGIPEKKYPYFKTLLSELGILEIREGMTAEIRDTVSLEDAIQKVQYFLASNQE